MKDINTRLLMLIFETIYMVLIDMNFSPSMKSDLRKKNEEYKSIVENKDTYGSMF